MDQKRTYRTYTRSGDSGETFFPLFKNTRTPKDHPALETIGTLDELNSFIGFARSLLPNGEEIQELRDDLKHIQNKLFHLGSMIIGYSDKARITDEDVRWLEKRMDEMSTELHLGEFTLPGGHPSAAALHVARAVCRRLERRLTSLMRILPGLIDSIVLRYVNRLSDYLFVAALYVNKKLGVSEERVEF